MKPIIKPIGENTAVTLGAVVVIVTVTVWVASIQAKGEYTEARVQRLAESYTNNRDDVLKQLAEQSGDIKTIRAIVERIDRKVGP